MYTQKTDNKAVYSVESSSKRSERNNTNSKKLFVQLPLSFVAQIQQTNEL